MENITELKRKLSGLAIKAMESPGLREEFGYLSDRLNVKRENVLEGVLEYTFSQNLTNEFFDSMTARFVLHLHHQIPGTYHITRQSRICEYLEGFRGTVIDMGFGVPGPYVFDTCKANPEVKFILADKNETAFQFAEALFEYRKFPKERADYDLIDMNKRLPGTHDAYLFLDSIEHVDDATSYLQSVVKEAPDHVRFIFALPICDRESIKEVHSIEWRTKEECFDWLNKCGLRDKRHKIIDPNPEVDLFAFIYDRNFKNLVVECEKARVIYET